MTFEGDDPLSDAIKTDPRATELGISTELVASKIHIVRGTQVMLDKDIAVLYGVKPIRLREQVSSNIERFPPDFVFQLTEAEVGLMVSKNAIPSRKQLGGTLPYVFTEQGVASLSGVLKSTRASEVHVQIMRAFVEMRRFLNDNAQVFARLDSVERSQILFETLTQRNFKKIFDALGSGELPKQGIFFDGQVYDSYSFIAGLVRSAKRALVLIDNYLDDSVVTLMTKRANGVSATLYTKSISKQLALDLKRHNEQYDPIGIREFHDAHDRFLIIDGVEVYHIGASLKDHGKKGFAFSRIEQGVFEMLKRLEAMA